MDAIDLLMEARPILEKGWCQGEYARDELGLQSDSRSPYAASWCLIGAFALVRVTTEIYPYGKESSKAEWLVKQAIRQVHPEFPSPDSLSAFNDKPGRTQDEILEVLDKAIQIGLEHELRS